MNILAIDTSGPVAGCAVMRDGEIVHSIAMRHGLTHSQTIMPAVEEALSAARMTCGDMDVFAVVAGPGSFTGVRIGVCAVKGLAHAAGKPCCAVDALEALAMNFFGSSAVICPVLDARRGQVYCAAFDTASGAPVRLLKDDALALEDFLALLPEDRRLIFLGDAAALHAKSILDVLGCRAMIAPENLRDLRADAACCLAARNPASWTDGKFLRPVYLRAPQAERERARRQAEEARETWNG